MKDLKKLEERIGVKFKNLNLLRQALVHKSYLNEHPEEKISDNERLEFLGDAIIEYIVTDYLYRNYQEPEGTLTAWRASLVNTKILSQIAKKFNLDKYLYLSKGLSLEKSKTKVLAGAFEALIGAIYLDQGLNKAKVFIEKEIIPQLSKILKYKLYKDAKSKFQEFAQEKFKITPSYKVLKEEGPDHAKKFTVGLYLGQSLISKGKGKNKQEAEMEAAKKALKKFNYVS
jgi:ribonuclease-3